MAAFAPRSPLLNSHVTAFNEASTNSLSPPSSAKRSTLTPESHRRGDSDNIRPFDRNSVPQDVAPSSESGQDVPLILDEDFPDPICGGCKKLIDEDSADAGVIHFATQLWHVDCFRCAKCQNLVTTDCDDILLLSDGNPICGQCNYSCQICGLPIMEEAIMTGDESYHAACFTCRSCHSPIAELVFAKTSQGIYCMSCHNQRVARSRRHADKKKNAGKARRSNSGQLLVTPTESTFKETNTLNISNSLESPIVASESDSTSNRTLDTTSTQPSSSSSLSPLQALQKGATTPTGNRPPQSPSGSHQKLQGSPVDLRRTSMLGSKSDREASYDAHYRGQSEPRTPAKSPSLPEAAIMGQENLYSRHNHNRNRADGSSSSNNGLGINGTIDRNASIDSQTSPMLECHTPVNPPAIWRTFSRADDNADDDEGNKTTPVQYKRASRLLVKGNDIKRGSKTFSFYDPDIVSLMDSISKFESSDELSFDVPTDEKLLISVTNGGNDGEEKNGKRSGWDDEDEDNRALKPPTSTLRKKDSSHSLNQMSNRVRESMKSARNGHVSMDTKFVESILADLDATREKMRSLQDRYNQIRRASLQAAQGFTSAREGYEQEVQARHDAETEMLSLKQQLHVQATKLSELTNERKQLDNLQRSSIQMKHSLQGMQRDLAKLTVERDLTVAEVAELVAMQDGREIPLNGAEDTVKRTLTVRLEGVKDRYRNELHDLKSERDALVSDIEELRHSRDTFMEELRTLSTRNEELNASAALLTKWHTYGKDKGSSRNAQSKQQPSQQGSAGQVEQRVATKSSTSSNTAGFGFGFGRQARSGNTSDSVLSLAKTSPNPLESLDGNVIHQQAQVSMLKAEAVAKKFKWKKTIKSSLDAPRSLGHSPVSPIPVGPSPPVPPKTSNQQASPYGQHGIGSPLLPQPSHLGQQPQAQTRLQQQQQHPNSANSPSFPDQPSMDQVQLINGGFNNGEIVVKEHLFIPYGILRPTRCFACQKNMWGQSETKCSLCNQVCHIKCLQSLPTSCNQPFTRSDDVTVEYSGPSMFGRALIEQVQSEEADRKTPLVVEKCIQAVENLGMDYEGIYRKSGGTSQLKIITQLFENRQPFNLEDRDRFNDISAITSVLKNYFRELPEPLLTYKLYNDFVKCAEIRSEGGGNKKLNDMRSLVQDLPREHFDTLKYLITHLHHVKAKAEENRMNSRNLGVVFGPTLMRSKDPSQEFAHMGGKAMTIEFMIDNPSIFD